MEPIGSYNNKKISILKEKTKSRMMQFSLFRFLFFLNKLKVIFYKVFFMMLILKLIYIYTINIQFN